MGNSTAPAGHEFPGPNHVLGASTTDQMYSANAPNTTMSPTSISTVGNNVPVPTRSPFLAVNYVIATQGLFPSRN